MVDESKVTTGEADAQADFAADLEVTACVEVHAHLDYKVIFAHNRSTFRPWAYPMPKEVAEYIAAAVIEHASLMMENVSLRSQVESANFLVERLMEENRDLAAQLSAANEEAC